MAIIAVCLTISCTDDNVKKGTISLNLGDYERAIKFYDKALNHKPSNAAAHLGMGKALFQKAKAEHDDTVSLIGSVTHIEAARTLNGTTEINSLLSSILTEHARITLAKKDSIQALALLVNAMEYDRTNSVPLNLAGIIYYRTGKVDKAAVLFDRAIELDSLDVSPWFNRGMIAWHKDDVITAHRYWLKALRTSPTDDEILYWFARAEKIIRDLGSVDEKAQTP